ncbi:unnamed protein product, partial [Rotaria sp. Silwood1]
MVITRSQSSVAASTAAALRSTYKINKQGFSVLFYLSTCLFGESTGPNIDNVTKSTNKETGGSTYGVVFETADNFFAKQINTHITTVATYLEKQVEALTQVPLIILCNSCVLWDV